LLLSGSSTDFGTEAIARLVDNVIHATAGTVHCVEIQNVGLAKVYEISNPIEILGAPGGKVVDATHFVTLCQHRSCQCGPNKTGYAGNEVGESVG
jgi:hypothetical protein